MFDGKRTTLYLSCRTRIKFVSRTILICSHIPLNEIVEISNYINISPTKLNQLIQLNIFRSSKKRENHFTNVGCRTDFLRSETAPKLSVEHVVQFSRPAVYLSDVPRSVN